MKALIFEAEREGYSEEQVFNPITVGELIDFLSEYESDRVVLLSHDRGYTFGTLRIDDSREEE